MNDVELSKRTFSSVERNLITCMFVKTFLINKRDRNTSLSLLGEGWTENATFQHQSPELVLKTDISFGEFHLRKCQTCDK